MKCERYGHTYHKRVGDLVFSSAPVLKVISLSRALLEGTVAHHLATLIKIFTATDAIRFEMDVVQYFARHQHETASRFANNMNAINHYEKFISFLSAILGPIVVCCDLFLYFCM